MTINFFLGRDDLEEGAVKAETLTTTLDGGKEDDVHFAMKNTALCVCVCACV